MNSQQLICFICVADRLNFTRAAEELFLSPPNVTHHIKMLENELKTTLFIRNSKMVRLTESGKEFYNDAKEILEKLELAQKKIARITNPNTYFLKIGCTSNAELTFLKPALNSLREKYPDVYPKFYIDDYFTLKKMFENDEIDVMLATGNMIKTFTDCSFKKIKTIINYAVFLKNSPLSLKSELTFDDLEEERLITMHPKFIPFEHSNRLRDKILEHDLKHLDMHCENTQTGLLLSECGYGIGIFLEYCIPPLSEPLIKRPFEKNRFYLDYGVASHKNIKNEYIRYFIHTVQNQRHHSIIKSDD